MIYDHYGRVLNMLCKYFIENFCVYVHQENGFDLNAIFPKLSFLCTLLLLL